MMLIIIANQNDFVLSLSKKSLFTIYFYRNKNKTKTKMGALGTALKANPLGAALSVAGLGASIFSSIRGAKANRANQKLLDKRYRENEEFYNNNANQDYLDTNAAKGMMERLRKNLRSTNQVIDNKTAVTGGTAEANVAAKAKAQDSYNDTASKIAEQGTNYKQRQEAIYRGEKASLDSQQMNMNAGKAQDAANVASNAAGLVSAAADLPGKKTVTGVIATEDEPND